jgi:hypothetical protein
VGRGFAGKCCKDGKTIFVNDPYNHPLFNPDVDKRTGYRTHSIMCMPLRDNRDKIIAVLQMLNRPGGFGRLQECESRRCGAQRQPQRLVSEVLSQ